MSSIRINRTLTYVSPDGARTTPSIEMLEDLIFQGPDKYWRSGNRNGCLEYVRRRGKTVEIRNDKPMLMFSHIQRHGFFFMHSDPAANKSLAVPFAGGECRPWVKHYDGQLDWYVPRACMVSRAFAWEIIRDFLKSDSRSPAVPWVDKTSLNFVLPGAGDEVPKGKDRA